jgi:hypothetical protein
VISALKKFRNRARHDEIVPKRSGLCVASRHAPFAHAAKPPDASCEPAAKLISRERLAKIGAFAEQVAHATGQNLRRTEPPDCYLRVNIFAEGECLFMQR